MGELVADGCGSVKHHQDSKEHVGVSDWQEFACGGFEKRALDIERTHRSVHAHRHRLAGPYQKPEDVTEVGLCNRPSRYSLSNECRLIRSDGESVCTEDVVSRFNLRQRLRSHRSLTYRACVAVMSFTMP